MDQNTSTAASGLGPLVLAGRRWSQDGRALPTNFIIESLKIKIITAFLLMAALKSSSERQEFIKVLGVRFFLHLGDGIQGLWPRPRL